jgi:hypothetical protein
MLVIKENNISIELNNINENPKDNKYEIVESKFNNINANSNIQEDDIIIENSYVSNNDNTIIKSHNIIPDINNDNKHKESA